jgi:hypothetical protein
MATYAAKGLNVSCRTINGEAFIFNQETKSLLKLEEVASFIWDQINGTRTVEEITAICCDTFEGDPEVIQSSVQAFIAELKDKNTVVLSAEPFEEEYRSAC